ncbi:MAG: ATP phosphoribosyltransferase regulatory subunit, partial [Clostridia bacterium]|nr:ATP phosphoribosyltransferase regulatory subunit [Clostridia bacterium]
HFEKVKQLLDAMNIEYTVNPKIVRGLDYYTRTVFEFVSTSIGAQGTVCGGGRYDGLVEELGGQHTPSLGFGLGIGRLLLLLESQNIELPEDAKCNIYIAPMGDRAALAAAKLVADLRSSGISAQTDISGRSLKAQMKYADKTGAQYTAVLGDNELDTGEVTLKNMSDGSTSQVKLENYEDSFMSALIKHETDALGEQFGIDGDLSSVDLSGLLKG